MSVSTAFYRLSARIGQVQGINELGFVICNDTLQLVNYRQAALMRITGVKQARLFAHSGLSDTDPNTPYALWLAEVSAEIAPRCRELKQGARLLPLSPEMLSEPLRAAWQEWLPEHVWIFPLTGPQGELLSILLIGRDEPWPGTLTPDSAEFALLQLCGLYGYAWWALAARPSRLTRLWQRSGGKRLLWALLLLLVIFCIPVREYTLVPAEIVSLESEVIAAPEQGVINRIVALPNSAVKKGDVLAQMDATTLQSRLAVALAELATADTTLHQTTQKAIEDQLAKSDLAMAEGRWREKQVEVASLRRELDKLTIRAPRDGVFVYSDPDEWAGRPVQTGERIGLLADPTKPGVRAWAPVSESTNLNSGAPMTVFLKVAPLSPLTATLDYAGYQTVEAPNGVASYILRGTLTGDQAEARIGLQGTARISGDWKALGYLLLRRPIATVRAWSGW